MKRRDLASMHVVGVERVSDVYSRTMARTNIEIDDTTLDIVMRRYGLRTKTEAVDLALRRLAGEPMTTEEALAMRGAMAIGQTPIDVGPEARSS